MAQKLVVYPNKCTECRTCELKCSLVHFGVFNTNKSGIRIEPKWPGLPHTRVCIQCDDPACLPVCPTEALFFTSGKVVGISYEDCIGCGDCVDACPYDGIWMDPLSGVAVKCDTCDGQFKCIPECFPGALSISV